jgi:hypothetical protein
MLLMDGCSLSVVRDELLALEGYWGRLPGRVASDVTEPAVDDQVRAGRAVQDDRLTVAHQRQQVLDGEHGAPEVDGHGLSDQSAGDLVEGLGLAGLVVEPGAAADQALQRTAAAQKTPAAHQ